MRRLMILTALAALAACAVGCGHLFNRGTTCGQPAVNYASDPCMSAPTVTEGTPIYGPVN
ncbi:MAG TPA: hypothetical protein VGX78_12900 [Pirellulales bacterium]|nr:hypothetical protein [Pirellulales bacterium]